MPRFTDQTGRRLEMPVFPPRRMVSLVPSQTELLHALGLEAQVVGITKFCVRPAEWYQQKQRVGGTKTISVEKIAALRPDIVIGNKEENERIQIEALAERFPVWVSDVKNLSDALDMIAQVGELTGKVAEGTALCAAIRTAFAAAPPPEQPLRAAYIIWRKPYMTVGGDTFIHDMLCAAGFDNVFKSLQRYPQIGVETLQAARPDVVLLASEPYPFAEKHLAEFQAICPGARVALADGEVFSWYGSRLLHAPAYFEDLRSAIKM